MEQDDFIGPVNLGNPEEHTIKELAELVKSLIGSNSRIVYEPLPECDPCRRCPDITLAREKLGWSPKVPLVDGLTSFKTIDYFRMLLNKQS